MSVVNINLTADHAWLACDTLQFDTAGRPHSFACKATLLPHISAVVGYRGITGLHHALNEFLNGGAFLEHGAESAAPLLPAVLRDERAAMLGRYPDHADHIKAQVWLLGWAPTEKRFAGWRLSSDEDDFLPTRLKPGTYLEPGPGEHYIPPAVLRSPDQLVQTVVAQRAMSALNREAGGNDLGIGGDVLLVQIDRTGMRITKAHRFEDFAQVRNELRERHVGRSATSAAA
jgi:hypothetical protein